MLMLLSTRTMHWDRSFTHSLCTASCPRTALALPGVGRPAVRWRRPSVMLESSDEKLRSSGNLITQTTSELLDENLIITQVVPDVCDSTNDSNYPEANEAFQKVRCQLPRQRLWQLDWCR